ncbi:MAG: CDP-alcohol phosphatidyltransferase family protein [Patescibacteria group bacterium]
MTALEYVRRFITDPAFQEEQAWVMAIIRPCAIFPANFWTALRAPGGWITRELFKANRPGLALLLFSLFALTDWVDGKVARYRLATRGGKPSRFGGLFDGAVDKIFVLPVLEGLIESELWAVSDFWRNFTRQNFWIMVSTEASRILMPLIPGFNLKEHAFAIIYGKIKFTLQVYLVGLLWIAVFLFSWVWWPFWINVILAIITILSLASILFRVRPELEKHLADVVTLGNAVCGSLAILSAFQREWTIFANLVALGAGLDAIDGALARKLKGSAKTTGLTFGAIADDIGDWITFALAPALALYFFDSKLAWVAGGYLGATTLRLAYFTWLAKKSRGESGVFRGLPSPAAAVGLASIFVWSPVPSVSWLGWTAVLLGALEVLFFLRWYHFKRIGRTARRDQFLTGIAGAVVFSAFGAGETLSFLASIYAFTFFRPVANWLWDWDKERK